MTGDYEHLLSPCCIGNVQTRNRIVMPPMVRNYATIDGVVNDRMVDHFGLVAKGGVGLVMVEATYVHQSGKGFHQQLGIDDDKFIPGLSRLAGAIKEWGAKSAIQLYHAGRQTTSNITGSSVVAPSALPCPIEGGLPREMTTEEVVTMVECFGQAARRAQQAGFDMLEIHGAHGYLISQFLSATTNRRNDKYGGDRDGRLTFAREVVQRTRELVGDRFPIIFRINATDFVEGGTTPEESHYYASCLQSAGVDALDVSAGTYECLLNPRITSPFGIESTYTPHGQLIEYAGDIKKKLGIPVITVGAITPEMGEEALRSGKADYIAIGRNLLVDPDLPNKLAWGQATRVRPCIRCNEMCIGQLFEGFSVGCTVNAQIGFEGNRLVPPLRKKRIMVVGGGPAGMEAARVAALRGHEVSLYEKSNELGGHLREATVAEFKEDLRQYLEWLKNEITSLKVKIMTSHGIDDSTIDKEKPDTLIVAIGSEFGRPPIDGIEKSVTASDIFLGLQKPGKNNIIAGGGATGCEVALFLAKSGKKAILVEMQAEVATDVPMINRGDLMCQLMDNGVQIITNSKIVRITDKEITVVDRSQNIRTVKGDRVILAMGLVPRQSPIKEFRREDLEVYSIGDCVQPRRVAEATREGYLVGSTV